MNQDIDLFQDIYYQQAYSTLYLSQEDSLFEFMYEESDKKILFRSIKRTIPHVVGQTLQHPIYDLESHYGYAGPLSTTSDPAFIERAFIAYREKCAAEHIVCEFIRFHPFNHLSNKANYFDFHAQEREVVVVDLSCDTADRWKAYSKTTRNILRKTSQPFKVSINQLSRDAFNDLYTLTMNKNSASEFYYFSPAYFDALSQLPQVELLSVTINDTLISCGYFMYGKDIAHYHLSANNSAYLKENGNYILLEAAFERSKALGCQSMMLGGGRTAHADDPLLQFKKKFSHKTLPFYIAGLIFLPDIKQQLDNAWDHRNPHNTQPYFQKYRQPDQGNLSR